MTYEPSNVIQGCSALSSFRHCEMPRMLVRFSLSRELAHMALSRELAHMALYDIRTCKYDDTFFLKFSFYSPKINIVNLARPVICHREKTRTQWYDSQAILIKRLWNSSKRIIMKDLKYCCEHTMQCWSLPTAASYRRTINLLLDVIMSGYIEFPQFIAFTLCIVLWRI